MFGLELSVQSGWINVGLGRVESAWMMDQVLGVRQVCEKNLANETCILGIYGFVKDV